MSIQEQVAILLNLSTHSPQTARPRLANLSPRTHIKGPSASQVYLLPPTNPMSSPSPKPLQILVIGAGITGLSSALALTKYFPSSHTTTITVLEIRPVPSTI